MKALKVLWRSGVNPMTLQPEKSCGQDSVPGRGIKKRHEKRPRTQLGPLYFCEVCPDA